MVEVEPLCQWPAGVEGEANAGVLLEKVEHRQVGIAVGLLDDPVEVADGLVVMENKHEADSGVHRWPPSGDSSRASPSPRSRRADSVAETVEM